MTRSRLRVGQLFALSIGLLVVFAVAGFLAGTSALDSLGNNRRLVVDRVDPALVSAQRFLVAMVDEETGVRGYVLGGEEGLLDPYERGLVAAPRELATLRRLVDDSGEVDAVADAAERWRTEYAEPTISARRGGRTEFTRAEVNLGRVRFDAVRAGVSELGRALQADRNRARAELKDTASRVRTVVIAFAVAIMLAVLVTALVLQRFVVAPLGRLAGRVRTVARGDFDEPVTADGAREVAELGADVEAMRARIVAELDALAASRADLQRSNAELEQFAYVASHDLQEPLRKVASFTQMLGRRYQGQLDERADQYIEFAVDGAKRMQDLINDLLAFSRVGRISEAETEVDCNELVGHAMGALGSRLEEAGARVEVGDLPTVRGEPSLLELVFTNLISNGVKFQGEEPPHIEVAAERRDGEWCFTVRDNGIGIEPEYADRIFVIFQRLHPRSVYEGTGIGLAMCRKIVEYHGGTIWLDRDTDGRPGATFHFTLPAIEETPA